MAIRLVAPRPSTATPFEETQEAADQQTTFTLTTPYEPGTRSLEIWVNGLRQYGGLDYTEDGPTAVTFTEPLMEGDVVLFRVQ